MRAPTFEFSFDLQRDEQAIKDAEQIASSTSQLNLSAKGTSLSSTNLAKTQKITFSKVQLQQFFEELEKIQIKLDEITA